MRPGFSPSSRLRDLHLGQAAQTSRERRGSVVYSELEAVFDEAGVLSVPAQPQTQSGPRSVSAPPPRQCESPFKRMRKTPDNELLRDGLIDVDLEVLDATGHSDSPFSPPPQMRRFASAQDLRHLVTPTPIPGTPPALGPLGLDDDILDLLRDDGDGRPMDGLSSPVASPRSAFGGKLTSPLLFDGGFVPAAGEAAVDPGMPADPAASRAVAAAEEFAAQVCADDAVWAMAGQIVAAAAAPPPVPPAPVCPTPPVPAGPLLDAAELQRAEHMDPAVWQAAVVEALRRRSGPGKLFCGVCQARFGGRCRRRRNKSSSKSSADKFKNDGDIVCLGCNKERFGLNVVLPDGRDARVEHLHFCTYCKAWEAPAFTDLPDGTQCLQRIAHNRQRRDRAYTDVTNLPA